MPITVDVTQSVINVTVGGGGSASGITLVGTAPVDSDDFTMFPGDIPPTSGTYMSFTDNWLWTFRATVDSFWQQSPRSQT